MRKNVQTKYCWTIWVVAVLLTFSISVFAQTKKESIKWINTNGVGLSKIEQRNGLYFSIVKVDQDSLYFIHNGDDNLTGYNVKQAIPLKGILYEDISTLERKRNADHFHLTNYAIKVSYFSKEKNKNGRIRKVENIIDFIFPFEDEYQANRVVSAIMAIARQSGAKENKQFF